MPKVLQINVTVNWGSHGKIAEMIGRKAIDRGWDSYIAYGRNMTPSQSRVIKIGSSADFYFHVLGTRITGRHGLFSSSATKKFIKDIERIKPDVIHFHNIHGYYLNYKILFEYLNKCNIPVIITMHDNWIFAGHCTNYAHICDKWKTLCGPCPVYKEYPSGLIDHSRSDYILKKELFTKIKNLTLVPVSQWTGSFVSNSFLSGARVVCIHNGIDTERFRIYEERSTICTKYNIPFEKKMIIGVASIWAKHRGYEDFVKLSSLLDDTYVIVLVGVDDKLKKNLPNGFVGIKRTDNVDELAMLYSAALLYMTPTWKDNFPTTNIEALACGTPVVTYNTGGSPEAIDEQTGFVVEQGDIKGLKSAVEAIVSKGKDYYKNKCRSRALTLYNMDVQYNKYIDMYENMLKQIKN